MSNLHTEFQLFEMKGFEDIAITRNCSETNGQPKKLTNSTKSFMSSLHRSNIRTNIQVSESMHSEDIVTARISFETNVQTNRLTDLFQKIRVLSFSYC